MVLLFLVIYVFCYTDIMKRNTIELLFLALLPFIALMFELLLANVIETPIYKKPISEWTSKQSIIHWIITCLVWLISSFLIIRFAKNKFQIDLFTETKPISTWQILLIIFLIIVKLYVSYKSWDGFKVIKEFNNLGVTKFVFQYIYYSCEALLVTLIMIFGQMFFESIFKNPNIPYGGILVAITWGIGHFFTKDFMTGILSALVGFAFGSVYLLTNCNFVLTYIFIWIMFVL